MENSMFCFQCEQTAGGKGCTKVGVCGKKPEVAALQDLLIYELKGIGFYGNIILDRGEKIDDRIHSFVMDGIFSTLTNVNFDPERFVLLLKEADKFKRELKGKAGDVSNETIEALYVLPETMEDMLKDAKAAGIMNDNSINEDIRSLRELLIYGLKGMGAYAHHAKVLGFTDNAVNEYFYRVLAAVSDEKMGINELYNMVMELGQVNLKCMELLDRANTSSYGIPTPTKVPVTVRKGHFIVVSGHDLKDIKELLEQTEGLGIDIYTHGEMLPAHAYPELKKYKHFYGNYGGAWQDQQKEFNNIPGCVLMTTNCIQRPLDSYSDRIFTTGLVGWPEVGYIPEVNGKKDFTPVIKKALELSGWTEDEPLKEILVGFGHNATLNHADEIINAVKGGLLRHFFLIGGCDGAKPGRNYYTKFAEMTPKDTVILTLACGKYRFNKLDFGTIGNLPRLLDMGQCNDAFSAIKVAVALSEAFNCSVNELPLTLILSWYEQKAVCILLTLLSLGIKNIHLGPTLPAFVSPNVLNILVDKFNIKPISTPEEDLKAILG